MNNSVPIHAPDVAFVAIDDETLIFDGEALYRLSGAAATVHRAVNGVKTPGHIAHELRKGHSGDPDTISRDVQSVLRELIDIGALSVVAAPHCDTYFRPETVAYSRDGDNVLLADLVTGRRTLLSTTAARIWDCVLSLSSLDSVVSHLQEAYPGATAVRQDVEHLLDQLVAEGFLVRSRA
jgi:Coenzyme PQQ synthesis protein D (PqqD)